LRNIAGKPFYWINKISLYDAHTGKLKKEITKEVVLVIANSKLLPSLQVNRIKKINNTGPQMNTGESRCRYILFPMKARLRCMPMCQLVMESFKLSDT